MGAELAREAVAGDPPALDGCGPNDFEMAVDTNGVPMVLGQGGFGKAELVRYRRTRHLFVRKIQKADSDDLREMIRGEAERMPALHPHLVQKYALFNDTLEGIPSMVIVMEFCAGKDLQGVLKKIHRGRKEPIKEQDALNFFHQLCEGIKFLHDSNVVHRDIKPENLFLSHNGKLKLGDFGLTVHLPTRQHFIQQVAGTRVYMAPEQMVRQPLYSYPVDMFAAGVTLLSVLLVKPSQNPSDAWNSVQDVVNFFPGPVALPAIMMTLSSAECLAAIDNLPVHQVGFETKNLLCGLLHTMPARRLTADQVLSMPHVMAAAGHPVEVNLTMIAPSGYMTVLKTPQEMAVLALTVTERAMESLSILHRKNFERDQLVGFSVKIQHEENEFDIRVHIMNDGNTQKYSMTALSWQLTPATSRQAVADYARRANEQLAPGKLGLTTEGRAAFQATFILDGAMDEAQIAVAVQVLFEYMNTHAGKHLTQAGWVATGTPIDAALAGQRAPAPVVAAPAQGSSSPAPGRTTPLTIAEARAAVDRAVARHPWEYAWQGDDLRIPRATETYDLKCTVVENLVRWRAKVHPAPDAIVPDSMLFEFVNEVNKHLPIGAVYGRSQESVIEIDTRYPADATRATELIRTSLDMISGVVEAYEAGYMQLFSSLEAQTAAATFAAILDPEIYRQMEQLRNAEA